MIASVNLQFSSFASRHNSSKLGSVLDLASVATPMRNEHRSATAARYDSAACDEGVVYLPQRSVLQHHNFSFPEECCFQPLRFISPEEYVVQAYARISVGQDELSCRPSRELAQPIEKNVQAFQVAGVGSYIYLVVYVIVADRHPRCGVSVIEGHAPPTPRGGGVGRQHSCLLRVTANYRHPQPKKGKLLSFVHFEASYSPSFL